MKNSILTITFCVSTILHYPLCSALGEYYFTKGSPSFEKKVKPSFVYQPKMREVTVTKVASTPVPKVKTLTSSVVKKSNVIKPHVRHPKVKETPERQLRRVPLSRPTSLAGKPKQQVIPPTADAIDMKNTSVRKAFFTYYDLLSTLIARFAVYPESARVKKLEGVSYVSFLLKKNGNLTDIVLRQTSGIGILDRSALSAVQNAAPFPPLPLEIKKNTLRINVPISFEIE